ncbi:MAG: FAD-dependent oxidoreductase [Actinomycetota bacterium]
MAGQTQVAGSFDCAVVGGGRAGATAALALREAGASVALFERRPAPGHRYGETLPPEIGPLLTDLGLGDDLRSLGPVPSPGSVVVWGSDRPSEQDFVFKPQGEGWHVDRGAFDSMLRAAAVRAGVCLIGGVDIRQVWALAGRWYLRESSGRQWEARFLLDASGRPGLRILHRPRRIVDDTLLAIVLRVAGAGEADRDLRTTIEAIAGGWWYTAPIPRNETVAMFFTDPQGLDSPSGIDGHLALAPVTAARLQGLVRVERRVLSVQSSVRARLCGPGWLAVGEAAASFDPLSGMGVLSAMSQGLYAGGAVARHLDGDLDAPDEAARRFHETFLRYRAERIRYYAQERRFGRSGFWGRRLGPAPSADHVAVS